MLFFKNKKIVFFFSFFVLVTLNDKVFSANIDNKIDSLYFKYHKARLNYEKTEYFKSMKLILETIKDNNSKYKEIDVLCQYLLGNIFEKTNNNEKALLHYTKSLKEYKLDRLSDDNKKLFFNDSIKYSYTDNLLKIGGLFHKLEKIDSAKVYYLKLINYPFSNKEVNISKAKAYLNLAVIDANNSKLDHAKNYIYKAIEIYGKINNKPLEAVALGNLASIYLKEENYKKAKETYKKGLSLIEKDNSSNAINYKRSLYYNLAWTLYLLKDYTAYNYQEKSYIIKDSLRDKEIRRMIEKIYAQQKVDLEKEKTNLVTEQRKLLEAEQNKTNLFLGVLALLVIIISTTIVYNYRLRQNNLKLKLSETNLLQQQNIEKLKSEAQIKILNATIDGKEAERKEIAETLHDNVSALLSSANMHLSATKKQFNQNTPVEIEKTQSIILEASQKVRDLSHNLVSSILLKFGLEYAIKDVSKKYSNSELAFHTSANNINRYNQEFEIKIFNVVQELINNILKHSKAKNAYINLKEKNNQLTILVKDDGVGFNTSSSSLKDGGIGLNQIEARIHMLNGNFSINSKENSGTTILIKVPVSHNNKKSSKLTSVS